jgi:hypothetical protein
MQFLRVFVFARKQTCFVLPASDLTTTLITRFIHVELHWMGSSPVGQLGMWTPPGQIQQVLDSCVWFWNPDLPHRHGPQITGPTPDPAGHKILIKLAGHPVAVLLYPPTGVTPSIL